MIAEKEADQNVTRVGADKIVPLPTVLSVFALVLSTGAVLWSVLHDPLGHGLSYYDRRLRRGEGQATGPNHTGGRRAIKGQPRADVQRQTPGTPGRLGRLPLYPI